MFCLGLQNYAIRIIWEKYDYFFVNQCLYTCEIGDTAFEHLQTLRKNTIIFDPEEGSLIFNFPSVSLF